MIHAPDDSDASKPFLLQGQDDAFSDRDGAVLSYRAEAVLDVPIPQQFGEGLSREDALLVADDVLRWLSSLEMLSGHSCGS